MDGKYRLLRPIARGGMAEVWLAIHESLRTELALKFIDAGLRTDPEQSRAALERFRFEAQISARLGARTQHIVAVHDAGIHDGAPYLVMEYVTGRTLFAELDEKGKIEPLRFADMLDQIADALSVAHDMGVVHRDLKPSNVMIIDGPGNELTVKVADFGIAKAVHHDLWVDRPKETSAGILLGSPNYMSPEQLRGASHLDHRSDVWALGVLAYEAITGWPPFEGRTIADLIVSISARSFEPPSKLSDALPPGLDAWFEHALAKDPERRFRTVSDMAYAYRAALSAPAPHRRRRALADPRVRAALIVGVIASGGLALLASRGLGEPHVMPLARVLSPIIVASVRPDMPAPQVSAPTVSPAPSDMITKPVQPAPRRSHRPTPPKRVPAPAASKVQDRPSSSSSVHPPGRKEVDPSEIH